VNKKKILFVCVGNAWRSIIAEAYAKALFDEDIEVQSGGIRPLGYIPPDVIEILSEDEMIREKVDLSSLSSKSILTDKLSDYSCIIVLSRIVFFAPEGVKVLYFDVEDPAFSDKEFLRQIRDKIKEIVMQVKRFLQEDL
jgi:arsenate reductase